MIKNYWVITSDNELYFFSHYHKANNFVIDFIKPQKIDSLILKRLDVNKFVIYGSDKVHTRKYFESKLKRGFKN